MSEQSLGFPERQADAGIEEQGPGLEFAGEMGERERGDASFDGEFGEREREGHANVSVEDATEIPSEEG